MDAEHFDTLARSLTIVGSRRQALTIAVGGALGMLGLAGPDDLEAKKKKPCPPCKKRKQGKCKANLPDGTGCASGTCQGGSCVAARIDPLPPGPGGCPTGQKPCAGSCIPSNQCCTDGDCPAATPRCCGGACLDVRTDVRNCGSCGTRCVANEQCVTGRCHCGFNVCSSEPNFRHVSCCAGNCGCQFGFQNPNTCQGVFECPSGTTPCIATTNNCGGLAPAKACCPTGTTCTAEGNCRID